MAHLASSNGAMGCLTVFFLNKEFQKIMIREAKNRQVISPLLLKPWRIELLGTYARTGTL